MTTPRPHDELAAQLHRIANTRTLSAEEIGALHTAANIFAAMPPIKPTITLTVNGREWVLPEPLRVKPAYGEAAWILSIESRPTTWSWYDCEAQNAALAAGQLYATKDDCQAWADFDVWCRGGGV